MAKKPPKINLFHIKSVEELEKWQEYIQTQPGYQGGSQDLSGEGLMKQMLENNYVVVDHDQPCPVTGHVDPGSIVFTTYEGMPARWLNGTILVRKDHFDQLNKNQTNQ